MKQKSTLIFSLVILMSALALAAPSTSNGIFNEIETGVGQAIDALQNGASLPNVVIKQMKKTFGDIQNFIESAQENIMDMYAELAQLIGTGAEINQDFLRNYTTVKTNLRDCRQELRKLATTTVRQTSDMIVLLNGFENNNNVDIVLLKATITTMKSLLIKTKTTLEKADEKYKKAIDTMEWISSNLEVVVIQLNKRAALKEQEYSEDSDHGRLLNYGGCAGLMAVTIIADILGCLGICTVSSGIGCTGSTVTVEVVLHQFRQDIQKFKDKVIDLKDSIDGMDTTVKSGVKVLENELEIIGTWNMEAENVEHKIQNYPVEMLKKFKPVRSNFITNIEALKTVANEFLAQPVSFYENNN